MADMDRDLSEIVAARKQAPAPKPKGVKANTGAAKPTAGQKAEKKLKAKRSEKKAEKREGAGAAPEQSKKDKAKKEKKNKPSGPSGPKVGKIAVKGGSGAQGGQKQQKKQKKPGQQGQGQKPKPSAPKPHHGGDDVKVTIVNEAAFNAGAKPKQQQGGGKPNKPKAGVKANLGGGNRPNNGAKKLKAKLGEKRQIQAAGKREGAGAGGANKPKKMKVKGLNKPKVGGALKKSMKNKRPGGGKPGKA